MLSAPPDGQYVDAEELRVEWSAVEDATSYELSVSHDGGPFTQARVTAASYATLPMPAAGKLTPQVRAHDDDGTWSDRSAARVVFRGNAPPPLSPRGAPPSAIRIGASAGYATNFGAIGGPLLQLEGSYRTPLLDRRVLALARYEVRLEDGLGAGAWTARRASKLPPRPRPSTRPVTGARGALRIRASAAPTAAGVLRIQASAARRAPGATTAVDAP